MSSPCASILFRPSLGWKRRPSANREVQTLSLGSCPRRWTLQRTTGTRGSWRTPSLGVRRYRCRRPARLGMTAKSIRRVRLNKPMRPAFRLAAMAQRYWKEAGRADVARAWEEEITTLPALTNSTTQSPTLHPGTQKSAKRQVEGRDPQTTNYPPRDMVRSVQTRLRLRDIGKMDQLRCRR
jgi:hypothetical protein